jgi:hypothetical protein
MFAYLIIAAELLVLYTVFWYIFLKEPKPYRIKSEMWGRYDYNALNRYFESLEHELHETNASSAYSQDTAWLHINEGAQKNRLATLSIAKAGYPQLQGAGANNGYCEAQNAKKYSRNYQQNYGWIIDDPTRLQGNPLKFAIVMVEKLGNLSSRRP